MKKVIHTKITHNKLLLLIVSLLGIFLYTACTPDPHAPEPSTPSIIQHPPFETRDRNATFTFSSLTGVGALYYKCKLNNGSEFDCGLSTSGYHVSYSLTVPGGTNTFSVRTVDDRGKSSGSESYTWLADDSAPVGGAVSGPSFSNTGSVNIFTTDFYDAESGIMYHDLEMQSVGVQASTDCTKANWSGAFWEPVYGTTHTLEDGCHRFRLTATNNMDMTNSAWHYLTVDKTAPVGGSVAGPATSSSGSFPLEVVYFSDAFTGIKSNALQIRTAPLSAENTCPTSNSEWGLWTATGTTQDSLVRGCYQYRLVAVDNGGLEAAIRSRLTRVIPAEENINVKPPNQPGDKPGNKAGKLRILSLLGPGAAIQGEEVVYTLRLRNVGEGLLRSVDGKAYGLGIASKRTSLGDMKSGALRKISVPVTFNKKGKTKLVFFFKGANQRSIKKVKWVRVTQPVKSAESSSEITPETTSAQ